MLTDEQTINLHDEIMDLARPGWRESNYKTIEEVEKAKEHSKFGLQLLEIIEKYSNKETPGELNREEFYNVF